MSLYGTVSDLIGPIAAEAGAVIDEARDDDEFTVTLPDGREVRLPMSVLKSLDRAHQAAFEYRQKRKKQKAPGGMFAAR